jgi:hypothetical protein
MGWYSGINSPEQLETASPDAVKFHGTFKSLVRMILAKVKTPKKWLDELDGNMGVIRDIYYEYLENEHQTIRNDINLRGQQDRKTIISSAIPFSIVIAHNDPNYAEVANWFLYQICMAYDRGEFIFSPNHINPGCWYQDGKGRTLADAEMLRKYFSEKGIKLEK